MNPLYDKLKELEDEKKQKQETSLTERYKDITEHVPAQKESNSSMRKYFPLLYIAVSIFIILLIVVIPLLFSSNFEKLPRIDSEMLTHTKCDYESFHSRYTLPSYTQDMSVSCAFLYDGDTIHGGVIKLETDDCNITVTIYDSDVAYVFDETNARTITKDDKDLLVINGSPSRAIMHYQNLSYIFEMTKGDIVEYFFLYF